MSKATRAQLAKADVESLLLDDKFKRFLYTVFETCGMFTGNFHSDGRIHAMSEGRRSLGLDILRTVEHCSPDALQRILDAETKTQTEVIHDNRDQYRDSRRRDLGDDNDDNLRPVGAGLVFLDYGKSD